MKDCDESGFSPLEAGNSRIYRIPNPSGIDHDVSSPTIAGNARRSRPRTWSGSAPTWGCWPGSRSPPGCATRLTSRGSSSKRSWKPTKA